MASVLAYWQARMMTALMERPRPEPAPSRAVTADRMLTAAQAMAAFGVSKSFLYERGEELGFARRPEGIRGVRFSERDLRAWMERRR